MYSLCNGRVLFIAFYIICVNRKTYYLKKSEAVLDKSINKRRFLLASFKLQQGDIFIHGINCRFSKVGDLEEESPIQLMKVCLGS